MYDARGLAGVPRGAEAAGVPIPAIIAATVR